MPALSRATLLAFVVLASAARGGESEMRIKAELLDRFARFVEWPASVFSGAEPSFRLCVLGADPFGSALDGLHGRDLAGKPVRVHRLPSLANVASCNLLFIAASERDRVKAILAAVAGHPILTVGDSPGFALQGVHINMYPSEDRMRFEVNLSAAKASDLKLGAQLLRLAKIVKVDDP